MLLSLVMLLNMAAPMPVAAASAKATAAKKAYTKYMKKYNVSYYRLTDLDKNGIPELLFAETYGTQYLCTYNYKTKKVVKLKSAYDKWMNPENFCYNTSKNRVLLSGVPSHGAELTVVRVKGTKLVTIRTLESRRNNDYTYSYYVNKKKVSEKTYNKYRDEIYKVLKPVKSA